MVASIQWRHQRGRLRDTSRRIIGYIEADGRVTNTSRQTLTLEELERGLD